MSRVSRPTGPGHEAPYEERAPYERVAPDEPAVPDVLSELAVPDIAPSEPRVPSGRGRDGRTAPTSRKVTFPGSQGVSLSGRLDLPGTPPRAVALFAHCFTCGKNTVAASRIARTLTRHGIGVLRFDFTGLGESEGDFTGTDFSSNVDDLVAAADYLKQVARPASILIGHSLGGAAVLAAAHSIPTARAVATVGAPADPAHVRGLLGNSVDALDESGTALVSLAGRMFRISRGFLDDIAAQPQAERIAYLGLPLLVLHSPTDGTVGVDNARRIFDTARHPKSFVALDGADHLLTRPADAQFAADVLATWALRHVEADRRQPPGR